MYLLNCKINISQLTTYNWSVKASAKPLQADGEYKRRSQGDAGDESEDQQPVGSAPSRETVHQQVQPGGRQNQQCALNCSVFDFPRYHKARAAIPAEFSHCEKHTL